MVQVRVEQERNLCAPEGQEQAVAATLEGCSKSGLQQGSCDQQMLAAFSTTATPCPSATCCPPGRTRSPPGPSQAVASPALPSWNPLSGACFLKTAFMLQLRRPPPNSEPLVVRSDGRSPSVSLAHQLFIVFTAFPTFLVQMCLCLGKQKLHKRGCICRVHSCALKPLARRALGYPLVSGHGEGLGAEGQHPTQQRGGVCL